MTRPNEEETITYMGWWSEGEKKDIPEPWERFTLLVYGQEAGDTRNATVEDLRLAGFVQTTEPRFTLEEIREGMAEVYDIVRNPANKWSEDNQEAVLQALNLLAERLEKRG